jgi:hypothetical protein
MNWNYNNLMKWIVHGCNNEEAKEIGQLTNLYEFYCPYNQIKEIPKGIGQLINLQTFYCSNNQIKEIPKEIGQLTNLQTFYCSNNQIKEIPVEIGQLINLRNFNCCTNQIKEIPIQITNLNRLKWFNFSDNEIEYISPIVQRFINRLEERGNVQKVYNDAQNVHNHNIQKCIVDSIYKIISIKPLFDNVLELVLKDNVLTNLSKEALFEYCQDKTIHSTLQITFQELLTSVWSRIEINEHKDEIKKILNQEILDSQCKCFTGRMSRLINCLNGFDEHVNIRISDAEQIANIIEICRIEANNDSVKHKELVINRLKEMLYSDDIIELWISFIE